MTCVALHLIQEMIIRFNNVADNRLSYKFIQWDLVVGIGLGSNSFNFYRATVLISRLLKLRTVSIWDRRSYSYSPIILIRSTLIRNFLIARTDCGLGERRFNSH